MDTQQKELPILPQNPTTLDRIIFAIHMLRYHGKNIVTICTLKNIDLSGFNGELHKLDDKLGMVRKAKQLIKDSKTQKDLSAVVHDNLIISGHLLQVRNNNQCVALIIVEEELKQQDLNQLKLPVTFLPVKETFSGNGKKNNVNKNDAPKKPQEFSKKEKKGKRYERQGAFA